MGPGCLGNPEAGYYDACLTSIDSWNAPIENGTIRVDASQIGKDVAAVCRTHAADVVSRGGGGGVFLPILADTGGCLVQIAVER